VQLRDFQRATSGEWMESLVEDKLPYLPRLKRGIAETLATGESTSVTAKRFGVTPGRVSQVRNELAESWSGYQGESLASV
jgi:hypothetical protein